MESRVHLPRRAEGSVFNMAVPLVDQHVSEGRGGWPALRTDQATISYVELLRLVNRTGNVLRSAGVQPEQRVALLLPDGVAFIASFIGAMKIGAVPVPLNTLAPLSDLLYFLTDSRARVLVTTPELAQPLLDSDIDDPRLLLGTTLLVGESIRDHPLTRSYKTELAAAPEKLGTFPSGVDEPCYWLYSSGTTGRPKGTVHLHGDMLSCVAPYAEDVLRITPSDVTFSVSRLFFSYGLVNSLFLPLLVGASAVLSPDRPDTPHVLDIVQRYHPTLLFSVPTSYVSLCTAIETGAADQPFRSLRLAISAGEPLPASLYHRWLNLTGVELLDGIGSTEVGYIYCSNRPGRVRPGSSGELIGSHRARIVDEHGEDVADGEAGELWVRTDSTALQYWNRRDQTKATFVGEWLRTGDRYRRDEDGYYWYLGRSGDVFKVSGQWVSPLEVESCLLEHPSILECAVIGQEDENGLVKTKAYIVRRPDAQLGDAEVQAHVKARLLPHTYPRWVEFVNELPKTATGKVQRYKLRD